jgi:hypothetical protein
MQNRINEFLNAPLVKDFIQQATRPIYTLEQLIEEIKTRDSVLPPHQPTNNHRQNAHHNRSN